jgi:methionyl-tRNA formyltransferase
MKQITLFLMSLKGLNTLKAFIENFDANVIDFVVGAKDPNVKNDYYNELRDLCLQNNIQFYDRAENYEVKSEYAYSISWRWLIHSGNTKLIVFHDSILPKYRGFAPLVTALVNGENEVGVTALYAEAEYDRGDIIRQKTIKVNYPVKINDAIELVSQCYIDLVIKITADIVNSKVVEAKKQDESAASYSLWLDDDDYRINWAKDAAYITRFIDSVGYPFSGALTLVDGKKARVLAATVVKDVNIPSRHVGKVIFIDQGKPTVVCGGGLLKIEELISDEDGVSLLPLKKFRTRFA